MNSTLWTDTFLESMRQEADPVAEAVVEDLFAHGETAEVMKLHRSLLNQGHLGDSGDLPPVLANYVEETSQLPEWSDPELIEKAEGVLMSHGFIAFVILACASLPECYADARGIQPLLLTQKLTDHAKRRILETSQFIIAVMGPGGLKPGGPGIAAAQMVRLMHASIRHLILHPPAASAKTEEEDFVHVLHRSDWDTENGLPLNQEDMAYTLQTFAWVTVRSLRILGAGLKPDEEWGVIHLWNVVGHLLGIRRDLMPSSVDEAEQLFKIIKARVAFPSPDSRALESALLDYLVDYWSKELTLPHGHTLQMNELSLLPSMMTRELIDGPTADLLGVPKPGRSIKERMTNVLVEKVMKDAVHTSEKLFDKFSKTRQLADMLSRHMLDKMTQLPRGWERELFSIPEELQTTWTS